MTSNGFTEDWAEPFLGEWAMEIVEGNDGTPTMTGSDTVRLMGSWLVAETFGQNADGESFRMITSIGFDPAKGSYVGATVGTMTPSIFVLDGHRDASSGALTLETEGPAITQGKKTDRYRDIWRMTGPDTREIGAEVLQPDGAWREFMRYRFVRRA